MAMKKKYWIARDEDNELWLLEEEPELNKDGFWVVHTGNIWEVEEDHYLNVGRGEKEEVELTLEERDQIIWRLV